MQQSGTPRLRRLLHGVAVLPAAAVVLAAVASAHAYDYPVTDPLLATVIGTSIPDYPTLPARVPSKSLRIDRVDDRPIPHAFWDEGRIRYSAATQRGRAPLIFLIAGTGSRYSSSKMNFLEALFYGAGFHVVALSSTTHPDFILTASRNHMPGYMPADIDDIYALMQRIHARLAKEDVEITQFDLAGFSLGGTQAAFLAMRDAQERRFGFHRVLLLNPSVSLYESSEILDGMFEKALPGGPASTDQLIADLLARLTPYLHDRARGRVDDEILYHIADTDRPTAEELQAIVAAVFRLSLANMLFTADVMNGGGHIVEKGAELGVGSSLTQYMKRSTRWTFHRYVDEMLLPYWQTRVPALSRDALVQSASLESIGSFLAAAPNVGVMTNADDLILTPANLAFLRRTFGDRARVYPHGGHGGNLEYKENAADALRFFDVSEENGPP